MKEKAEVRELKEKRIDSNLSYPTYGRGIDPNPDIDTYMINKGLSHEVGHGSGSKTRKDSQQQRPKIISPRRQKYETQFEKFMVQKYVEEAVKEPELPVDSGKFDTITKLTDSLNAMVKKK